MLYSGKTRENVPKTRFALMILLLGTFPKFDIQRQRTKGIAMRCDVRVGDGARHDFRCEPARPRAARRDTPRAVGSWVRTSVMMDTVYSPWSRRASLPGGQECWSSARI